MITIQLKGKDEWCDVKEVTDMPNSCVQCGTLRGGRYDVYLDIMRRVYSTNGCAPTIHTCGGGGREPKILEVNKNE